MGECRRLHSTSTLQQEQGYPLGRGCRSVQHTPAASWGRHDSGTSLPWAGSITVHLMDVLAGASSDSPHLGTKSLLEWRLQSFVDYPSAMGLGGRPWEGRLTSTLSRAQLLTPAPVRGELSSWWTESTHICGMVPQGAFEWCLESIPVQGSRTLSGK